MIRTALFALLIGTFSPAQAAELLPKGIAYDPKIPTPDKVFGFAAGERHLRHDSLLAYLRVLDDASDRVTLQEYARSHGQRPLVVLTITAPANQQKLEEVRQAHLKFDANAPAVIWMGYGVHGNEPSASNVAPWVAYHLAAATGPEHEKLLNEVIVLLDPCLNPDGFDRFANWANDHRGATLNADPNHREHKEAWPGGRTNYYWFDLNRDWLPAVHPESRGRLGIYHRWKPNVVLDFHEMGTNSTYFFQPGVPSRAHPLIPPRNLELTRQFGKLHADALDKIGSLYFTEERFDDFYPGKGSTYPDLHGGVGILFEQASSRGHAQDSPNGRLTFPFTIRNQFETSLSSLRGTLAQRKELIDYQRQFYRDATKLSARGYLISAPGDPSRLKAFLDLLHLHDIRAYALTAGVRVAGLNFLENDSYLIPAGQPESRFIEALFESRTEFADPVFYDISAWTLPLAYGLQYSPVAANATLSIVEKPYEPTPRRESPITFAADDLGYAIDYRHADAAKLLPQLLSAGIKVRVAASPYQVGETTLGHGTLVVPLGIQPTLRAKAVERLTLAAKQGIPVFPIRTGLTPTGIDLGSGDLLAVSEPRVLLVTGEGVYANEAGEVWHLFDRQVGIPVTLVDAAQLGAVNLDRYTAIVMVTGTYSNVSTAAVERLKQYATRGGTLVAMGSAIHWLHNQKIVAVKFRDSASTPLGRRPYTMAERDAARDLLSGAIFRAKVDATHPLAYGYDEGSEIALFRDSRVMIEPSDNVYSTPLLYTESPLMSGFASPENQKRLGGSAGAVIAPVGTGRAILLPQNPAFRGFWRGTERILINAVFFGPVMKVPTGLEDDDGGN